MKKMCTLFFRSVLVIVLVLGLVGVSPMEKVKAAESYYWPVYGHTTVTSGWCTSARPNHYGIDIGAPEGTAIYATKSGTVYAVGKSCNCYKNTSCACKYEYAGGWIAGCGYCVVVKHNDGTWATYAHLQTNSACVSAGTQISQGQMIARVGSTGRATGAHLHFVISTANPFLYSFSTSSINNNKDNIAYVYEYAHNEQNTTPTDGSRISNYGVENITDTTASISAAVSPAGNVTEAGFYLGTSPDNMQKTVENASASGIVKISYDLGTGKWCSALQKGTTYYYQIYAVIDGVTYKSTVGSFMTTGDGTAPTILSVYAADVDSGGYTVVCTAVDNTGVSRVCFPTWTDANGQDDIFGDWYNTTAVTTTSGENTYLYRVNVADHGNGRGGYSTHVYVYDGYGNYSVNYLQVNVPLNVPFGDVGADSWYYSAVADVYEKGYMSGKGNGTFDPAAKLTRAETAMILYGMEGKPYTAYAGNFPDVYAGTWYADAVSWAYRNGVVSGYGNGRFGTSDNVTREQLAVMLYGYAQLKGKDTGFNNAVLDGFYDCGRVSGYALNAMKWAVSKGLISGNGYGALDPQGETVRGDCAVIISNFSKNVLGY